MSGSGGVEINVTANVEGAVDGLEELRSTADSVFSSVGSAAAGGAGQASASLASLREQLAQATAAYNLFSGDIRDQAAASMAALQAQIAAMEQTTAATARLTTSISRVAQSGVAYQIAAEAVRGWSEVMGEASGVEAVLSEQTELAAEAAAANAAAQSALEVALAARAKAAGSAAVAETALAAADEEGAAAAVTQAEADADAAVSANEALLVARQEAAVKTAAAAASRAHAAAAEAEANAVRAAAAAENGNIVQKRAAAAAEMQATQAKNAAAKASDALTVAERAQANSANDARSASIAEGAALRAVSEAKTADIAASRSLTSAEMAVAAGAERVTGSMSKARNEAVTVAREFMSDRWTRIPGSLSIIVQQFVNISTQAMVVVGALALVAGAFYEVAKAAEQARKAEGDAAAGATLAGNIVDAGKTTQNIRDLSHQLGITTEQAGRFERQMTSVPGATSAFTTAVAGLAQGLSVVSETNPEQLGKQLGDAFKDPVRHGEELLKTLNATGDQLERFSQTLTQGPAAQRQTILQIAQEQVDKLKAAGNQKLEPSEADKQSSEDAAGIAIAGAAAGQEPNPAAIGQQIDQEKIDNATKSVQNMQQALQDMSNTAENTKEHGAAVASALEEQLKQSQDAYENGLDHRVTTTAEADRHLQQMAVDFWSQQVRSTQEGSQAQMAAQDRLKAAQKAMGTGAGGGGGDLAADEEALKKQEAAILTATQAGKDAKARANQQMADLDVSYWAKIMADTSRSADERKAAEEKYTEAVKRQQEERLSLGAHEASEGAKQAKESLEEKLAELTREQAANKEDAAAVEKIEQQKLQLIKSVLGEQSKLYQEEATREIEMARKAEDERVKAAEEGARKSAQARATEVQTQKTELEEEYAADQISKQQMLQAELALVQASDQANVSQLDSLIRTLKQGSDAWTQAMQQRTQAYLKMQRDVAAANAAIAADSQSVGSKLANSYLESFSKIDSQFAGVVTGVLSHTETMRQGMAKLAKDLVSDMVSSTVKILAQWTASQLTMTSVTEHNAVIRAQAEGATGYQAILQKMIAQWTAKETTQTAVTQTQARIRGTADESGSWLSMLGQMLAKWLGLETSKTAATAGQAAARTVTENAAGAEQAAATSLINVDSVESYAAVGGAAAGSAMAGIPVVGPELGAAASAAMYAGLSAYSSLAAFATGAYELPRDMVAQLHQGEMVVPANFASGLRNGQLPGQSAGSFTVNHSPTVNIGGGSNLSKSDVRGAMSKANTSLYKYMKSVSANQGNRTLPGRGLQH